nr:retrovirus-related Pol polyprotein from transposon TNT 1-94 [Tanacetum cinerariifolium]
MDSTVQQSPVDKQCFENAKKDLYLENDRLLHQIMSQDVLLTVMNSMSLIDESMNEERKQNESCDKCFNREAELLKSQNAHNDLLKSAKKVIITPKNNVKKVRFAKPLTSSSNIKQSQLNANSEPISATCKKSMFDGVHDMCLLDFVKNVNSHAKSLKKQNIWKPMSHVFTEVIQIVLWYPDSRCLKHMTGNHSQLMNFISKFLGTVRFGNDYIARIISVRNVQTDNGTEFVNQTLCEFYENVGISHQTSVARTPQQNGVVERRNQTLVEAAYENIDEEKDDEVTKELYKDVNVNLENKDADMTYVDQEATPTPTPKTSEATFSFTSLLDFPSVFKFNEKVTNLEKNLSEIKQVDQYAQALSSIPAIVYHYIDNKLGEAINKAIQAHNFDRREEAQAKKREYIKLVDSTVRTIIKEEVNAQLPQILPQAISDVATPVIKKKVTESLETTILTRSSSQPQSSYKAAATLFEFELTKILIDKMEKNKSFNVADYKRELYGALIKSYNTDKDIFESYSETQEILVGPTFNLLKGTCKSIMELEYHLEECSKATTERLDWHKLENKLYPFDLRKPFPLIQDHRGRQIIPKDYFINKDLEYLKGGDLSKKYSTSVTKTKAATYELKWIVDLVLELLSPVQLQYDQHAYLGTSHWGPKRQRFYEYASNLTSSKDVYSRRRIITVTSLKIMKKYDYSHLEEIEVRRDDHRLYTFKEDLDGIIYIDQNRRKILMRTDELHKFSDGMLNDVSQNQMDLPRDIPLDSVAVLRYEKKSTNENQGKVPTEMELVLEQTQQGISYEVSVSAEGVEELKRKVKIKGEKKEALLTLSLSVIRSYGGNRYTLVIVDDYSRVFGRKCFILNTKDYLTKCDPKSYEGVFLGYSQSNKAYIILNKDTRKVKQSINVKFDKTPPQSKTSPLVDDDLDKEEAIKATEKKIFENNIEDETLEIDEVVNIKESYNNL